MAGRFHGAKIMGWGGLGNGKMSWENVESRAQLVLGRRGEKSGTSTAWKNYYITGLTRMALR
jgi:hypothetical protein